MHASRSETYLGPGLRPVGLCVIQSVSAVFREHCLRWHVEAARGRATVLKIKFRHSASREFDSVKTSTRPGGLAEIWEKFTAGRGGGKRISHDLGGKLRVAGRGGGKLPRGSVGGGGEPVVVTRGAARRV